MVNEGRSWSGRERNNCFLNTGGVRFADISAASGLDFPDDGRAAALSDWDQDGDVDLWISNRNAPRLRWMRNESPPPSAGGGHWIAFRLRGNGATTNRDAIGARVEVFAVGGRGRRLVRSLRAGEGFLSQSSKWLHFGLGGLTAVEMVAVTWPGGPRNGTAEEFRGFEVDRRYDLVQGSGRAREWKRPAGRAALAEARSEPPAEPAETSGSIRIPLIALLPLPTIEYEDAAGLRRPLRAENGRPLLVNLWASRCAPCLEELAEFAKKENAIRAAGLDVLALSVDGLATDRSAGPVGPGGPSDPAAARKAVERLRFPFAFGRAGEGLVQAFQYLHDGVVVLRRPLPVPTSFLIDPRSPPEGSAAQGPAAGGPTNGTAGRLAAIYKGRVTVETVIEDISHASRSRRERFIRAAPLPGSTIGHELTERAAAVEDAKGQFQLAVEMERAGRAADAAVQYREVLRVLPDFAEAHNNLGLALSRLGSFAAARRALERALELKPTFAEVRFNLGIVEEGEGRPERAAVRYREALDLKSGLAGAHEALGLLHARRGDLRAAREEFELEVRLHPGSASARNHLGLALLDLGAAAEARLQLEEAVRLDPRLADARNNLGAACRRLGMIERAEEEYREAIALQPSFAEAHNNLGAVLLRRGKLAEARATFERALAIRPDFAAARVNLDRVRALLDESGK